MKYSYIEQAVEEINGVIVPARVQGILQMDDYTFLFSLYSFQTGEHCSLLASVLKKEKRFHVVLEKIHREYLFSSPAVELLGKHLKGTRLTEITLYEGIVCLEIVDSPAFRLAVDFFSANIYLYNHLKKPIFCLHKKSLPELPTVSGYQKKHSAEKQTAKKQLELNQELTREFIEQRNRDLKKKLGKIIKTEEKKIKRLLGKLEEEKKEVDKKDWYKHMGEIIKYNLSLTGTSSQKAGKIQNKQVTLSSFDGSEVALQVDPSVTLQENMEAYFKKYKKLKRKEQNFHCKIAYV